MLGGFQRSPNEFIPVHKHLRSYRPRLTVWNLPEEIMIQLLKSLHVKDLLSMRAVRDLDNHDWKILLETLLPIGVSNGWEPDQADIQ